MLGRSQGGREFGAPHLELGGVDLDRADQAGSGDVGVGVRHGGTFAASASPSSSTRERTTSAIDDFIEATASGQASEKRRRLDELTSILQRGDRLVVSELSRLGRSLGQIVTILDALAKAGVAFVALKEKHPRRRRAGHPDQGHGHALRAVRPRSSAI